MIQGQENYHPPPLPHMRFDSRLCLPPSPPALSLIMFKLQNSVLSEICSYSHLGLASSTQPAVSCCWLWGKRTHCGPCVCGGGFPVNAMGRLRLHVS